MRCNRKVTSPSTMRLLSAGKLEEEAKNTPVARHEEAGALGGAFWGMFLGLLFLVPFLGAAIGAAMGALSTSMVDMGISDQFIDDVKKKITPGTSALFLLMSDDAHVDRVKGALEDLKPELIASNLSAEQEAKLREIFAED